MKNWKESYKAKICTPDEAIQKLKMLKEFLLDIFVLNQLF